jgi:large subunit ribosomal protein L4
MIKVDTYSIKGVKALATTLPKEFDQEMNAGLMSQAVRIYEERAHVGLRNTKTRSEVNRTTKKIYKQKGTGGARHGSRRANVFVGGGVIFGPRPLRRILSLSDRMKMKAKLVALNAKAEEKELVVVNGLSKITKTKDGANLIKSLTKSLEAKRFTIVLSDKAVLAKKSLKNLDTVKVGFYKDLNAFDVFKGGILILDAEIFEKVKPINKLTK